MTQEEAFRASDAELLAELARMELHDVVTYQATCIARHERWTPERLHLVLAVAQAKQAASTQAAFIDYVKRDVRPWVIPVEGPKNP
jgi:hypothetical protein